MLCTRKASRFPSSAARHAGSPSTDTSLVDARMPHSGVVYGNFVPRFEHHLQILGEVK